MASRRDRERGVSPIRPAPKPKMCLVRRSGALDSALLCDVGPSVRQVFFRGTSDERKTIKFVVFKAICGDGDDQRDRLTHKVTKRRRLAVQSREKREERQVKPPAKSPSRPTDRCCSKLKPITIRREQENNERMRQ